MSIEEIRALFVLLSKASVEMKFAVLPQLPLELAVIEYCQTSSSPVEQTAPPKVSKASPPEDEDQDVTVHSLRKQVGDINRHKALYGEKKEPTVKREEASADVDLLHTMPEGDVTAEWLAALWKAILSDMRQHNHTLAGVLRGCKIKHFDRKQLILETAYQFHKEKLDEPKTQAALHQICKTLTGKDVAVKVELKK